MGNLYGHTWRQVRTRHLATHPLCVFCGKLNRVTPATVVDHIIPHRGDEVLFWDADNLQSLCKPCHDGAKQAQEKNGFLRGSDLEGLPLDAKHPWYREERAGDE